MSWKPAIKAVILTQTSVSEESAAWDLYFRQLMGMGVVSTPYISDTPRSRKTLEASHSHSDHDTGQHEFVRQSVRRPLSCTIAFQGIVFCSIDVWAQDLTIFRPLLPSLWDHWV